MVLAGQARFVNTESQVCAKLPPFGGQEDAAAICVAPHSNCVAAACGGLRPPRHAGAGAGGSWGLQVLLEGTSAFGSGASQRTNSEPPAILPSLHMHLQRRLPPALRLRQSWVRRRLLRWTASCQRQTTASR